MNKKDFVLLLFLLAFGLLTRFYRLDYADGQTVFDETKYYRPASLSYLNNQDDPNFEHPPLSKELVAFSISLFGDNPYGWRLPSLIFSLAGNAVIYFFIRDLFKSRAVGFLTSLFLSLDFLYFIHSRLAVPETIFIVLSWLSLYFLWRFATSDKPLILLLGGLFLGLSLATKWSAILLLIAFTALMIKQKKYRPLFPSLLTLIFVSLPIYLLAYLPFISRHGLPGLLDLQPRILTYWLYFSEELKINLSPVLYFLNHAHAWILNPAWAYDFQKIGPNQIRLVWGLFHPLLWFASVFFLLKRIFIKGLGNWGNPEGTSQLLVLSFFVPWLLPTRIEYPYYFLSGLPFLYALTAQKVAEWQTSNRTLFWAFILTVLLIFAIFYPLISGLPVPQNYLFNFFQFQI